MTDKPKFLKPEQVLELFQMLAGTIIGLIIGVGVIWFSLWYFQGW